MHEVHYPHSQPDQFEPTGPITMETLVRELGFYETAEMQELRLEMMETYRESKQAGNHLKLSYKDQALRMIDGLPDTDSSYAHLGLDLMLAGVIRDAGHLDEYTDELYHIALQAQALGLAEVVEQIDSMRITTERYLDDGLLGN